MTILIVEDNPVNAVVLEHVLKNGGYQTVVARNAKDALASLSNTKDVQLIITDLGMPDMDGLEFIANLKGTMAFTHLPIIVVSAHSDVETVSRVRDLECNRFLVKPIDKNQLLKQVKLLLQEQSPVLRNKYDVMNNLGAGAEEYDDLINALVAQLGTTMPAIVLEQAASEEAISESTSRLLKELAESATILGADKFSMFYSRLKALPSITRSHCVEVLNVLQELETALKSHSKPLLKPAAPN